MIVSYNSMESLPDCLEFLNNQSYRPLEVIIVDNGSTDGSADWLKSAVQPDGRTLSAGRTLSDGHTLSDGRLCPQSLSNPSAWILPSP